ncbi:hypothetical protein J0910_30445 [Nocardiopsis sp. CNT-189]|uniref:hypothetical protein n=1 Tax=Nocardiopsis oceanisediminis TaxID=2816862 RepID=UPI003B296BFD
MADTHTAESFTRDVVRREAEKRGVSVDWDAHLPEEAPEGLRHAVFKVEGRWCVWATRSADPVVLPSERDFYPLDSVLAGGWERVGWNGIRAMQ